jgi:hypothetical protein
MSGFAIYTDASNRHPGEYATHEAAAATVERLRRREAASGEPNDYRIAPLGDEAAEPEPRPPVTLEWEEPEELLAKAVDGLRVELRELRDAQAAAHADVTDRLGRSLSSSPT